MQSNHVVGIIGLLIHIQLESSPFLRSYISLGDSLQAQCDISSRGLDRDDSRRLVSLDPRPWRWLWRCCQISQGKVLHNSMRN